MQNYLVNRQFVRTSNWYVLQVRYDKEMVLAEKLNERFSGKPVVFFVPTRDRSFKIGGVRGIHKRRLFEKYLFVASTYDADELQKLIQSTFMQEPDIFGFVCYGDERENIKLYTEDRDYLASMLNEEFNIPAVQIKRVGQKVVIVDGGFQGFAKNDIVKVKKINRYERTIIVDIDFFGKVAEVELAFDDVDEV